MAPTKPLPYNDSFSSTEDYVESLLDLVENNELLRTLCGGVHVLDFFTSDPPLYSRILPQDWRDFFEQHEIVDLLDLYLREDLDSDDWICSGARSWRSGPAPPASLVEYIKTVRRHLLDRIQSANQCTRNRTQKKLPHHVAVGMTIKKVHEVGLFASYIDNLAAEISASLPSDEPISHLVDFGSGQSYLGRALASEPYNRHLVAIESKVHNAERAKFFDVKARLVEGRKVMRNKKAFRNGELLADEPGASSDLPPPSPEPVQTHSYSVAKNDVEYPEKGQGTIQHVEHRISSGDLTDVIASIPRTDEKNLMVISLHSCGNLVHHGLRSLTLNPSVKAVAMVGCCYNLITERLGPATYKHPVLRPTTFAHPRLGGEGETCDPDGFPMSKRLCTYGENGKGVRLNITARMMAVQAPANWGKVDSDSFFKRHFYRALLQRIFLDRGVVGPPSEDHSDATTSSHRSGGVPILIGSLRKTCYDTFLTYVRGALAKLIDSETWGAVMQEKMGDITNGEIQHYAETYKAGQKELSVMWSMMAFSAGVVEAAIVVDRWLWLREQGEVGEAWVESLFDYRLSPRNLVVVGIKKQ
ncbi:methyltransferase domain-containing protein [Neohortaea acidophila]|uniref:Methyltransferase domain-containing protein n=1 Tax=Neohortaea acidophila TaxID=245834 RepID=A0A6A6PUG6_9PEZI|nr:methyltransferase domain-containing protein [Neohortaea acidophila]KAF2483632.1 methyltransferase domain-containing protein [Neohortaea acidophila]